MTNFASPSGFFSRPVYVYMWGTGVLYFLYTFIEGHAYLIPMVRDYPVADLQIQWKHCGTVVAAFNMLVYGSLMYLGELVEYQETENLFIKPIAKQTEDYITGRFG